jgi:hypothetical protein
VGTAGRIRHDATAAKRRLTMKTDRELLAIGSRIPEPPEELRTEEQEREYTRLLFEIIGPLTGEEIRRLAQLEGEAADMHGRLADAMEGIYQHLNDYCLLTGEDITGDELLARYQNAGKMSKYRALRRLLRQGEAAQKWLRAMGLSPYAPH